VTTDRLTLEVALNRRLAVWGMGAEGLALARLAADRGVEAVLIDDLPDEAAGRVEAALGEDRPVQAPGDVEWSSVDVVVRSPGVSRYRAELVAAESDGVTVTTAMALWLEDHADAPVLVITGTKGKSTTAALAAAVLEADGQEVELIGNIGVPVVDTYGRPRPDVYVVEVSSYQAADVTRTPRVVVLTSLAPDHLDWHGGVEAYYRDKLRLVEAGPPGRLAVNAGNEEAVARTKGHPDRTLFGPDGRVRVGRDGWIEVDGTSVVDSGRLRVPGRHNAWNVCGAITGILLLTDAAPSTAAIKSVADTFTGLPSRCHVLGERDGRTYVDDALASNPFAAATSVESFAGRPLTIIVGGADRGVDPGPLVDALAAHLPAAAVVVLPPDPNRFGSALDPVATQVQIVADLDEAVRIAEDLTPPGGVVLFSPGAPTPEGGGGYRSRSRAFIEATGFDHD
jgi:UDP-N-acetylmuramoylalanine--D-glutamate ligase